MPALRKILLITFCSVLFASIYWSVEKARDPWKSDIAVLYGAAHIVMDPSLPDTAVYDTEKMLDMYTGLGLEQFSDEKAADFIYSIAAAYLFVPLTPWSYDNMKLAWNLSSLIFYMAGVFITLKLGRARGPWIVLVMTFSLIFTPLLFNQWFIQVNTLLFFLITLSAFLAFRNFPVPCGFILGIASLFKLFPIALALALGLRNWRITAACAATFGTALLIPGSLEWFPAISKVYPHYTYLYLWFEQFGLVWFVAYAGVIAALTVFTIWNRSASCLEIIAITIPAIFLVMPIVEIHHLTLLIFTYVYIMANQDRLSPVPAVAVVISFLLVNLAFFNLKLTFIPITGLFILWAAAARSCGSDHVSIFKARIYRY